jgi:hypothetical protein
MRCLKPGLLERRLAVRYKFALVKSVRVAMKISELAQCP